MVSRNSVAADESDMSLNLAAVITMNTGRDPIPRLYYGLNVALVK